MCVSYGFLINTLYQGSNNGYYLYFSYMYRTKVMKSLFLVVVRVLLRSPDVKRSKILSGGCLNVGSRDTFHT